MGDQTRAFNAWVTAMPAPDLEGQWVAHCLEFDVVSQGTSLEHAIHMISEATGMVLLDDLHNGKDPYARRAPVEDFELLWNVLRNGDRVPEEVTFSDTTGKYVYAFPTS